MKPFILIVEDERPQADLVNYNLEKGGFRTSMVEDGREALRRIEEDLPDLVVLDWMLPGLSGIEICHKLRQQKETKHIPIIMLTARGEEEDRLRGLGVGADDYVVKPHSSKELVARVRAVLRRAKGMDGEGHLEYAGVVMDLNTHKVTRDGQVIHLGPTEFQLLRVFLARPTRVFSRDALLDQVWGRDVYVEDRTVDVHVGRLRKALHVEASPTLIRTIRSVGYSIDRDASSR